MLLCLAALGDGVSYPAYRDSQQHRLENNGRIRSLSTVEETALPKAIEAKCPEHRSGCFRARYRTPPSEQYRLT
jgi:hypothetical protein